jgi:hypothetical protein
MDLGRWRAGFTHVRFNLSESIGCEAIDAQPRGHAAQPGQLALGELSRGGDPGFDQTLKGSGTVLIEP